MSRVEIRDSDIAILIAAIQNSVGPIQVDAEKVASQLGMSLSTIPPKFTALRKRYNIDIKVLNSGALQRKRVNTPKKATSRSTPDLVKPDDSLAWAEGTMLQSVGRDGMVCHVQEYPATLQGVPVGMPADAHMPYQHTSENSNFHGSL